MHSKAREDHVQALIALITKERLQEVRVIVNSVSRKYQRLLKEVETRNQADREGDPSWYCPHCSMTGEEGYQMVIDVLAGIDESIFRMQKG